MIFLSLNTEPLTERNVATERPFPPPSCSALNQSVTTELQPRGALCAPAGNRAPKLSQGQGQHCFGSKASRSPSFSAEAWNKRPPVPKAYRYLASGIDQYGSTLLPPGFLAEYARLPPAVFHQQDTRQAPKKNYRPVVSRVISIAWPWSILGVHPKLLRAK